MKIASADVAMSSQHSYTEATTNAESLNTWTDKGSTAINTIGLLNLESDTFKMSDQAKSFQTSQNGSLNQLNSDENSALHISDSDKRMLDLIDLLFRSLTGKRIKFIIPQSIELKNPVLNLNVTNLNALKTPQSLQLHSVGGGLIYNKSFSYQESESTSFSAQAAITTQDGRKINLNLQLNLSRQFSFNSAISIRQKNIFVDPLVINYGAASASVTQKKYQFDLNADGKMDQISFAAPGSGFLALDLNKDGVINDGKELFGTNSGNGFSDLANYDTDNNGWIDENDPIYDDLKIWTKDAEGNDQLFALGQKGIGAIYLGNIDTSFALKDAHNQTDAQLQQTGIFLRENGTAGTVQHINLAI